MILIGFLFTITLSIGIYFFFFRDTFSKEDIILQISGPKEAISGKEVVWLVSFKNKSEVPLRNASLTFEYPIGVFDKEGKIKKREQKRIGDLLSGEEKSESFSGLIFGTKEELKEAKSFFVYSPKDLSTQFKNEGSFQMRISETSVIFSMALPLKVNPEEEFLISLDWQSGFSFPLENVQVRLFLPDGFERVSNRLEDEENLENLAIFDLGSLNEGEGGKRELKGRIKGEAGEEKFFKAEFGIFDEKLYEFIPLDQIQKTTKITTSTLDVFRKVNGDYNYTAYQGEELNYIIEFKNSGENSYEKLSVIIELEGSVLDFGTLKPIAGGKIDGKKIIFSYDTFPDLLRLGPYGEGSVGFNVKVKNYDSLFHPENGFIKEKVTFGTLEKDFQTKISSVVSISGDIYYNLPENLQGKFDITGPNPLEPEQESILAVVFEIKNIGNALKDVKIETTLPEDVDFDNKVFPEGTDVNFDSFSRKLTLNIGDVSAYTNLPKIFAVQIKARPKTVPEIILNEAKLTGIDSWTDRILEAVVPSMSTGEVK